MENQESPVKSIVTSTPKQATSTESTILREKHWQNIIEKQEGTSNVKEIKKIVGPKRSVKFNDNHRRRFKRYRPKQQEEPENYSQKRRNQAVEAMKIAEQRRLRLSMSSEEENLVEQVSNLHLDTSRVEYLPDGRLKLSKKQLITRRMKLKRIREHLALQAIRKKNERKPPPPSVHRPNPVAWTPRPKFQIQSRTKIFRYASDWNASPKLPAVPELDENAAAMEEPKIHPNIIRYTKSELRELNPYGFYFM